MKRIPFKTVILVTCPNPYGPNDRRKVKVYNEDIAFGNCYKCKYHDGMEGNGIICKWKEKDE